MKQLCQNAQFSFHSNENLMGVMISYLSWKDIISLSQLNKLYRKVTKNFDFYFKEPSYGFFFSQYETYNINNQLNCSDILSSHKDDNGNANREQNSLINTETPVPSLYTWKGLFGVGVYIKNSWLINTYQQPFLNDLTQMRSFLYSNLKECEILPHLRKQNLIVEGEFNSPLQTFLYDFLYEQQDLYDEYDCKMEDYKTQKTIQCRKAELPFCELVCKFNSLVQSIDTTEKKEALKRLRWFMCFDNKTSNKHQHQQSLMSHNQMNDWHNNDDNNNSFISFNSAIDDFNDNELCFNNNLSFDKPIETEMELEHEGQSNCLIEEGHPIELNQDLVNKMVQNEDNPLFFVINCICLTMTFYCQYAMNYLFLSFNNQDTDILNEYIKIYKNYIDTAIGFNDYCENVNVAMNYCYEEIWKDQLAFPKFSVFRLLVLTWNKELTNWLNKNDNTMLRSLKNSLLAIVEKSLNEFTEKAQLKNSCDRKGKENEEISIEESVSTKYSSIFQSDSINAFSPMSIDDCLQDNESVNTCLMEQGLSILSDTFSDEYSVFSMNLSHFEVNSFYMNIEKIVLCKIEAMINSFYQMKVHDQSLQPKVIIDSILQYFTSTTYSSKILTQLKMRIYQTTQSSLISLLNADMETDLKNFITSNKLLMTKEFKAKTYFDLHPNTMQNDKVYQTLYMDLTLLNTPSIAPIVKEYCAIRYLKEKSKLTNSYVSIIHQINDWMTEEEEKAVYKNKMVINEIKRKNIQEYSKYQKQILSYCWRPNWIVLSKGNDIAHEKKQQQTLSHSIHHLGLNFDMNMSSIKNSFNKSDLALSLKLV